MSHAPAYLLAALWALPALAQDDAKEERVVLPSGLEAKLQEMLWDRPGGGLVYRFRFVAPAFEDAQDLDSVSADLEYLCNAYALPRVANTGPEPHRIIVSLADKPSEFGQFDPSVTQVFEAYSVGNGACIWEMF
jgi:hypothetical protein